MISRGNFVRFNDLVKFNLDSPELLRVKDYLSTAPIQSMSSNQNGLNVRIAATHAGIITRNNGLYLPQRMRKGASSFTDDYPKPVLLHHEDHKDNVGRIIKSGYIDTSSIIKDQYDGMIVKDSKGKEVGTITKTLIDDFVNGKMSFHLEVDIVTSIFRDSLLDDDAYEGLGHIQVIANITDKAAIERLVDGRYLTGSVGATTNKAVCSICKTDWTEEGKCDHKPGGIYDSTKCFIIAGDLFYDEYSFVNVPADRHSRVLELHYNGITDNIEMIDEYNTRIYEVSLGFPQYDSKDKEEVNMEGKKKVEDSSETKPEVGKTIENIKTVVEDNVDKKVKSPEQDQKTPVKDSKKVVKDIISDDKKTNKVTIEDFVVQALNSETLTEEDYEKMYDAQWAKVESSIKDGTLEGKKLDTAKRKKLAKSIFCGPNRTLPVTDSVHAVAVLRLLDKLTLEDTVKEKILKAVNRKVKAKDWDLKDSTEDNINHARMMHILISALEENHWSGGDEKPLADEEKGLLSGILKRLAGEVGKDAMVLAITEAKLITSFDGETALMDEVEELETSVGDLRDQLNAVRKEYNNLFSDMEVLQDALAEEKKDTRDFRESHLSMLFTLRDKKKNESSWTELSDNALASEVIRLTDEVDMNKIIDKLGDGMSRKPNGESIDDPNGIKDKNQERQFTDEYLSDIHANYLQLRMGRGEQVAENYIKHLKAEGKLPKDDN